MFGDCYDYQSTCGAKKLKIEVVKYTTLYVDKYPQYHIFSCLAEKIFGHLLLVISYRWK